MKSSFSIFYQLTVMCVLASMAATTSVAQSGTPCEVSNPDKDTLATDCSNLDLRMVPTQLPANTTLLDFSGNVINRVTRETLSFLSKLRVLVARESQISFIAPDTFRNSTLLTEVHLSRNSIGRLDASTFTYTPLLRVVDLSNNFLIVLPSGLFRATPQLFSLDLGYNSIRSVPGNLLFQCDHLAMLRLAGNSLDWLPPELLSQCPALATLDISDNSFSLLSSDVITVLSNMTHLSNLKLNYNKWICDCRLDPLVQLLLARADLDRGAKCEQPQKVAGHHIVAVLEKVECSLEMTRMDGVSPGSLSYRAAESSKLPRPILIASGVLASLLAVGGVVFLSKRLLKWRSVRFNLLVNENQ